MGTKVLCRRAEELKSIDELNLSDDIVRLLNLSDMTVEEMICEVRYMDMLCTSDGCINLNESDFFWQCWYKKCNSKNRHTLSDEECEALIKGKLGAEYLLRIWDSIKNAGFLNDDIRSNGIDDLDEIAEAYTDFYIYEVWFDGDNIRRFNRIYESFEVRYEERVKRILNTVKNGLTPNQFAMVKFDLAHPGLRIECGCSDEWYDKARANDIFAVGQEDYYNLKAARYNCRRLFKEKIMKILS